MLFRLGGVSLGEFPHLCFRIHEVVKEPLVGLWREQLRERWEVLCRTPGSG